MSSTTKHTLGLWIVVTAALALVACAQGVGGTGDDDDTVDAKRIDAPQVIDAPQAIDARIIDGTTPIDGTQIIDASGLPDAMTTGCTTHAACGAGNCCFGMIMCIPGDPLPLPPPFDCLPS